jgi:hypothetical protein
MLLETMRACSPSAHRPTCFSAIPLYRKNLRHFGSLRLKWDHREGQARRPDLLADHLLAG